MSKEKILLCKSLENFIKVIFLIIMETCFCYATQTGDDKLISFQWRMVQTTPCAINGEQPVIVSFGNVGISKIDTGRYVQDLNYSLNCGGATSKDNVLMFIKANPTTWDAKAIATNITGLGAQVLKEGAPLELNTDILISDPAAPPALQIRLVKEPDAILTDQPFTATGTMIVEYM